MKRNAASWLLACIGGAVMLMEVGLHWYASFHKESYSIGAWPVLIGAAIAFVGGYIRDPNAADHVGNFVVNTGLRIVRVVRTGNADEIAVLEKNGRRSTDKTVVEVTELTEERHESTGN